MKTYEATIDGGEGGDTIIKAESAKEAMAEAIAWARKGDWPEDGCDVVVTVQNQDDEDDNDSDEIHIKSWAEQQDEELESDGRVIAENEHEYHTERIVILGDEAYYQDLNGGARGSYDRMGGDGVWREAPVTPTKHINRSEARRLLLDWGKDPDEVAGLTKDL